MDNKTQQLLESHAMRCAGCGAKVANSVLQDVLHQLPNTEKQEILTNFSSAEDAALIQLGDNKVLLQSVDQIKAFINDPWVFARIATNHCLSELYAGWTSSYNSKLKLFFLSQGTDSPLK